MTGRRLAVTVFLLLASPALNRAAEGFDPTDAYQPRTISGFAVLVNPAVLRHPKEADAAAKELTAQLGRIMAVVPKGPLEELKKFRIWVEWENKDDKTAVFHPSAGWLKAHGYNPDKAAAVEIGNARNFVEWSQHGQPWMVLHELSHGYHQIVLGQKHQGVLDAYSQAMKKGIYESVEYVGGEKKRAYAATDVFEYFAEASEAYFGKNDFYPFVRKDLEKHDPVAYQLLRDVWEHSPAEFPAAVVKAEEALQSNDLKAAQTAMSQVPEGGRLDKTLAPRAEAVRAALAAAADKAVAEADALAAAGQYPQAVARLKEAADGPANAPAAARAKKQLSDLLARPGVKAAVEKADRAKRADDAFAAAQALKAGHQDEQAYAAFKAAAKDYADTPAGPEAARAAQEYEKDPAFVRRAADAANRPKATAALQLARNYAATGRTDLARKKYQEVVDQYPATAYADQAKKAMAALPK